MVHDLRIAVRQMIATPIVTAVAVLSLALGIGANTAIFSLVNSLSLRALPVKEPQRLAILDAQDNGSWTYPILEEVRQRSQLFDGVFAWDTQRFESGERRRHRIRRRRVGDGRAFSTPSASARLSDARSPMPTMCGAADPTVRSP